MWAIRSMAVLLFWVLMLDSITHLRVHAKFRGAQPKKIPSLAADGGVVDPNAGVAVLRKEPSASKGVRRTKGGLLPWWVRKRLQEQAGTEEGKLYKPGRRKDKTRLKNAQILQLERDERQDVEAGTDVGLPQSGDSAIVVKDLPLEDGADQGADDRLAAFDTQLGLLAENAENEELSRGSGAEPDLLMDDAFKQAVKQHERAAVKASGQQLEQLGAAGGSQEHAGAADAAAEDGADEDSEIMGGQEEQGSLDDEEGDDEDSARRKLQQKPKKKRKKRGKQAQTAGDIPNLVSRSLPDEILPAEEEEAAAAGLQLSREEQRQEEESGEDDDDDRDIVMTDVSKAEREAEQKSAVSDPGDSDNFEEGLLSAAAEETGGDAAVYSRETAEVNQDADAAEGGRGRKPAKSGGRRRKRKGKSEGPRRAAGEPARKRGGAKRAGAAAAAEGGERKARGKMRKGKGRRSKGQNRSAAEARL